MILRNYFYLCIDRLDWIPNLKRNFSFFLLHLRIIGNFFKFFSILNPRTKQLSENYFSWTLYLKQRFIIRRSFSAQIHLFIEKKESIHITMMFVPKLFQSSLLFAKQFTIPPPRFISCLLLLTVSLGKKIPHKGNERKGWKERRGRAKITIRDKVSSL